MLDKKENLVAFPANHVIFKENEFTKDIYILKKGRIKLIKKVGNKSFQLGLVEPGSILGELSIIDNGPRSATAITTEPCEAVKITPKEFKEGLKNIPDWFLSIARVLAQRIRLTDNKLNLTGPVVNEANITAILIYLFHGCKDNSGLSLEDVERTLVELLHIPLNELSEAMENMQKKRLITIIQGKIQTDNIALLEGHLDKLRHSFKTSSLLI
ncbi:MAG: cyclic nucleotide-binding domain-containing protein [Fibrobacterota bacterium]